MGKRIHKSKRHKKLKFVDPAFKGQTPRTRKKHLLPNEPPVEEDYQEVPNKMGEFINLKQKSQTNKFKRKRKKKKTHKDDFIIVKRDKIDGNATGMTKPLKKGPEIVKQRPFESQSQFFNRLQKMADQAFAEAKVEQKYEIDLVSVTKKGNAKYVTAPREVSETKREKRKKYREKEAAKKKMKRDDPEFELKKEHIPFGEVVTAPPMLTAKPRKAPEMNKPGRKNLVLKELLGASDKSTESENPKPLSTKWKNMAPERRKVIENERQRAIQLYRMFKNKKTGT